MANPLRAMGRGLALLLGALLAFVSGAWGALALWYQLPGGVAVRSLGAALWAALLLALFAVAVLRRAWWPLGGCVLLYALLLAWWSTIAPSGHHVWADDVARLLTGEVHGNVVTLHDVRDFSWRSDDDYDAHWETQSYDLDRLVSADAVLSHWGSRAIAHAMISFGFDDGQRVVFSVEIRRRRGQRYSPFGGFFKQFETALVAADERDIIRVRTNVRGEDDYLYPLRMDRPAMRTLFLAYVQAANRLVGQPEFYNTLTSNCTTLVYRMARQIDPGLPWDARLLLTGYLPGYLHDVGAVDRSVPLDELRRRGRITGRARNAARDDFSLAIRTNEP